MKLKRGFFNRPTLIVARQLLGKYLVRKMSSAVAGQEAKIVMARITEVEAYCGAEDKACHASKGLTPRTKIMFGPPGHAYIYMIYGMYHCLNFVTEEEGNPSAVLIRGVEGIDGPGKLCREFKIDKKLNGIDLVNNRELWVEDSGEKIKLSQIKKGKRIGVGYAGVWQHKLWRFYIKDCDSY